MVRQRSAKPLLSGSNPLRASTEKIMRKHLVTVLLFGGTLLNAQDIYTIAGIPYNHRNDVDSQPALMAPLGPVYGLLIDKLTGRLIFHDQLLVLRLETEGTLLTVAGTESFYTPLPRPSDSNLASALRVGVLRGMAQDAAGAFYLADAGAGRVYRIAPDGTVSTFAGGGTLPPGFQSNGGPATAAQLLSPRGLVFDSKGNLDIAEVFCSCIRKVTPDGIISTVYTLPPPPMRARLPNIEGLAIDAQDNLYFTEYYGHVVVRLAADGSGATTIAGTGTAGYSGDGGLANAAQLSGPSGVTLDASGNLFIADTLNHRIRKVASDGTISTFAGTGTCGFSGDGGPAVAAQLCQLAQTVFDGDGTLLIADYGNRRVRRIAADGTISTIAGSGANDPALFHPAPSGNGGPEIHAAFNLLSGAAFDSVGNLYLSDSQANVIRKISVNGTVSTFAGTGENKYSGDGGPAANAAIDHPGPLSVSPDGSLYVISGDSRIRKISPDGTIHLVAGLGTGTGLNRSGGDGGLAVHATLNEPGQVAFDQQGNVYIADTSNARVRKIDKNGIITTVAGPGQQGVDYYNGVAVDAQGQLYVAWTHAQPPSVNATVNRVNPDGSLTAIAGNGQPCPGPGPFTGEGMLATQIPLCAVVALTVDHNGLLNLAEGDYGLVLRLAADGMIQRVAGNRESSTIGDGGPALQASLVGGQGWLPGTVIFDPAGSLYLTEPGLNYIRELTTKPYALTAIPASIDVSGSTVQTQTVALSANFAEPFPYAVRVSTADGANWLSANRVTGVTGESLKVRIDSTGLAKGCYHGTVSLTVSLASGARMEETRVPVMLTVS